MSAAMLDTLAVAADAGCQGFPRDGGTGASGNAALTGSAAHGRRWSAPEIVSEIAAYHRLTGRTPAAETWKRGGTHPSHNTVLRHFGSWANAVEAAGFTRPRRGITLTSRFGPRGPYKGAHYYRRPSLSLDRAFSADNGRTLYDIVRDVSHDEWEEALFERLDRDREANLIAASYVPLGRVVILTDRGPEGPPPVLNAAERYLAANPSSEWTFSMLDDEVAA